MALPGVGPESGGSVEMPPALALLPLLIISGLIAFVLHWPRMRAGSAGMRLAARVGITTLVLFALLGGLLMVAHHLP